MSFNKEITTGAAFSVPYPFVRDTYTVHDANEDGWIGTDVPTWTPGARFEDEDRGDGDTVADAIGHMVLTVVSVHKPGRYPARVFFTRAWVDPDGKPFGKPKLRITTSGAFRSLVLGYRHPFVLRGCQCPGCAYPYSDHRQREEEPA